MRRRAELNVQKVVRAQQARRDSGTVRLAEIGTEPDGLAGEFDSLRALCESAYRVRAEVYNRTRYSRAHRKVTEVPPGPPFDCPEWGPQQPYLISVQSRSA